MNRGAKTKEEWQGEAEGQGHPAHRRSSRASKHKDVRYFDIREGDELAEAQMATWVKQAAALPGWVP
jgi:hypothetical protein